MVEVPDAVLPLLNLAEGKGGVIRVLLRADPGAVTLTWRRWLLRCRGVR